MTVRQQRIFTKVVGLVLITLMISFTSCNTVGSCWICENQLSSDWQEVCNAMSKNKLESYGYTCTPY